MSADGDDNSKIGSASDAVPRRTLGTLAGTFVVPENFDGPLPDDIVDAFENPRDVTEQKARTDIDCQRALDELAQIGQEIGVGYEV